MAVENGLLQEAIAKVVNIVNKFHSLLQHNPLFQMKIRLHLYRNLLLYQNRFNRRCPRTLMTTYQSMRWDLKIFCQTQSRNWRYPHHFNAIFANYNGRRIITVPVISVSSSMLIWLRLKTSQRKAIQFCRIVHEQINDALKILTVQTILRLLPQIPWAAFFLSQIAVVTTVKPICRNYSKYLSTEPHISQTFSWLCAIS